MDYKQPLKELAEAMGKRNKPTIQKNLLEASEYIEKLEKEVETLKWFQKQYSTLKSDTYQFFE